MLNTARLDAAFEENFTKRREVGASVSIWHEGREIYHRSGGGRTKDEIATWKEDTLVPVWSCTKAVAALTFSLVLHEAGLDLATPLQQIWPEMESRGSVGMMMSHQLGLCALSSAVDILDHESVARALAEQRRDSALLAYHPRTYGFLLEECCRRLTGNTLGKELRERVTGPLEADFWIGLPPEMHHRVARLYPGSPPPLDSLEGTFYHAYADMGSLTRRAFLSPVGLPAVGDLNTPTAWAAGLASMGGVGSARGLGKIYALLAAGGWWRGQPLIPEVVMEWCRTPLIQEYDAVLHMPNRFSAGFMMDPLDGEGNKLRTSFGAESQAFGHPGAGGSLGWAQPVSGLAFAYVMNQMEPGVLPSRKALALVEALGGME